jgi:hypothetical protein
MERTAVPAPTMAAIHTALPSGVFSHPKREPPSLMVKIQIIKKVRKTKRGST